MKERELELLEKAGAKDIEGYTLINNYGYTFNLDGERYDARYWANCYGVALNYWRIGGGQKTDKIRALEKALNE